MGIAHPTSIQCVQVFFDAIADEVINKSGNARFRDFGSFYQKIQPFVAKKRNPKTGEFFSTKGSITLKFKPIKEFKDKIAEIPTNRKKLKGVKKHFNKNFYMDFGLDKIEEIKKNMALNQTKNDIIKVENEEQWNNLFF